MPVLCSQCQRVQPEDAVYCYFDGFALAARGGAPAPPGSAPFPAPFVFPNGRTCKNFDQLTKALQQEWRVGVVLLEQGFLANFLAGLGRTDLASVAREAAQNPDTDRGLDQLLARIPSTAVQPPKLHVEPTDISLGRLAIGDERTIDLRCINEGMRLLYGVVSTDAPWLVFGEGAGQRQLAFQTADETRITLRVRGSQLRAGTKPCVGHVQIESNGGAMNLEVTAEVPVTPFRDGLFAGCISPRQIAERAKASPKDAAAHFERGEVAAWYAQNGWNYPVVGPTVAGFGGVQQFFEALGVAKPPDVRIHPECLNVLGVVGEHVTTHLEVTSPERKVIYAWATCDAPWIDIGAGIPRGSTVRIPITIRKTPSECVETPLEARIVVTSNGKKRFDIPLRLTGWQAAQLAEQRTALPPPTSAAEPTTELPGEPPPWLRISALAFLALVLFFIVIRQFWVLLAPSSATEPNLGVAVDLKSLSIGMHLVDAGKKISFFGDELGRSNSTVVRVDQADHVFGKVGAGKWSSPPAERLGTFRFAKEPVELTQEVQQNASQNEVTIRYRLVNRDTEPRELGLRLMLDTVSNGLKMPGADDRSSPLEVSSRQVPDFVQTKDGLRLHLRTLAAEVPDRLRWTHYPGALSAEQWEVPLREIHDSVLVLVWSPKRIAPGGTRDMAIQATLASK